MTLQEINDTLKTATTELDAIIALEAPELTDADKAAELSAQIKVLEEQRAKFAVIELSRKSRATAPPKTPVTGLPVKHADNIHVGARRMDEHPDKVQMHAGAFLVATFNPDSRAEFKELMGYEYHTQVSTDNNTGGIFIPQEVSKSIIDLQVEYGVFARNTQIEKMNSETLLIHRFGSDVTSFWGSENVDKTKSNLGNVDGVTLTAKNLYAYGILTEQLIMNSAIDIGARWIRSAARSTAKKIDQAGFLGDGTSTHGGIVGLAPAITALSATIADIAGLVVATGNLFSEFTMLDFLTAKNLLIEPAHANAKWYINRRTYGATWERIAYALGGVTSIEATGMLGNKLLGYPVEFVEIMPKADVNSQIAVWFGDMKLATAMGDRQAISIKQDTSLGFRSNTIHIKQDQYLDIAVHGVGNASATASLRQAGPMVGIISAAS